MTKIHELIKEEGEPIFWAYKDPQTGQFYKIERFQLTGVFRDPETAHFYQIERVEKFKDGIRAYGYDAETKEKIELNTQQLLNLETLVTTEEVKEAVKEGNEKVERDIEEVRKKCPPLSSEALQTIINI